MDDSSAVPVNVRPRVVAGGAVGLGLFGPGGDGVAGSVQTIATAPLVAETDPGVFESSYFNHPVTEIVPAANLEPNTDYELVVAIPAAGQRDAAATWYQSRSELEALAGTSPGIDAGTSGGGCEDLYVVSFRTGSSTDEEAPPAPSDAWLAHFFDPDDEGSSACLAENQTCIVGATPELPLLATLTYEIDGEEAETSVYVTRTGIYMPTGSERRRYIAAEMVALDAAGNRSAPVSFTEDDIVHRTGRASCRTRPTTDDVVEDAGVEASDAGSGETANESSRDASTSPPEEAGAAGAAGAPTRPSGSAGNASSSNENESAADAARGCGCRVGTRQPLRSELPLSALVLAWLTTRYRRRVRR